MGIKEKLENLKSNVPSHCQVIAVSKTYPPEAVQEAYDAGHKAFGENKVQELAGKYETLPKDIEWHLIGHLQRNKVKYIAPFVHLIHSVDSLQLLKEINKEGIKNQRVINCLLQIYICREETKFGLSFAEAEDLLASEEVAKMDHIKVVGLMGMATNTDDEAVISSEFHSLKAFFDKLKNKFSTSNIQMKEISMGMSGDYKLAVAEGSTMIRVGSAIFGARDYSEQ